MKASFFSLLRWITLILLFYLYNETLNTLLEEVVATYEWFSQVNESPEVCNNS
jgi:proline dehydrogenase